MAAIQEDAGLILAKLLSGDTRYQLSAIYVEFENVADPGDPVTPPEAVPASEGVDYYESLSETVNRDFVRVPISFPALIDTDETLYDKPNRYSIVVDVPAGVGVHGRTFNSAANSKVFGLAIVATPDWDDRTQDLIFSRQYYEEAQQMVVPASAVLRLRAKHTFPTE